MVLTLILIFIFAYVLGYLMGYSRGERREAELWLNSAIGPRRRGMFSIVFAAMRYYHTARVAKNRLVVKKALKNLRQEIRRTLAQ